MTPSDQTSTLLEIFGGSFPLTKHSGGRYLKVHHHMVNNVPELQTCPVCQFYYRRQLGLYTSRFLLPEMLAPFHLQRCSCHHP